MAISFYDHVRQARKADDLKMINPKHAAETQERGLPYGKKASSGEQEDEGLAPQPGKFDRNTMNPYEEEEFPRKTIPGSSKTHLRSTEDVT